MNDEMKNLSLDHEITTKSFNFKSNFVFYTLDIRIIRKNSTCILKCIIKTEFDIIFSKTHDLITNGSLNTFFVYFAM